MRNIVHKKTIAILTNVPLSFWLLLCFVCGNDALYSAPMHNGWSAYQNKVLKEKPNFPGWCPDEKAKHIMNLLLSNNSEICVELGVFGGSSFFPMAAALAFKKQGVAYAVDPWSNEACLEGYDKTNDDHHKYWGTVDLVKIMDIFIEGMRKNGLDSVYKIMRMTSAQAYLHFKDKSIDFIHIDGNHSEKSAVFDVEHWLPKVKKGGIICFDDAWWKSTQPAIKILLKQCDIMEESSPQWQYVFLRKR